MFKNLSDINMLCDDRQQPLQACAVSPQTNQKSCDVTEKHIEEGYFDDDGRDRSMFEQAQREIIDRKLFLNPSFSRNTYMKLCLINKNGVAKLMQRYAGTNLNGYINGIRLEYAVRLMHENQDLPIKAVAYDSGFRCLRTFYRLFLKKYGVTPTKYKERL